MVLPPVCLKIQRFVGNVFRSRREAYLRYADQIVAGGAIERAESAGEIISRQRTRSWEFRQFN
jgi:hypothetical protein